MKQRFSDRSSFLKAMAGLKDATFLGTDLVRDEASREVVLSATRPDPSHSGAGGLLAFRRPAYIRSVVTVRHVAASRQSLANGRDDVYVIDRAEVDRGGLELTIYFRPGDRIVMEVDRIDGEIVDAGRATAPTRRPSTLNPLARQEIRRGGKS